jgi:hypothetical protein
MKQSRTAGLSFVVDSPTVRSLPLVELLVDTKAERVELMVRSGLRVLDAMLEEDRTALCGQRYVHDAARTASRAGAVASEVVLGGRKVAVQRPRVRAAGRARAASADGSWPRPRRNCGPSKPRRSTVWIWSRC